MKLPFPLQYLRTHPNPNPNSPLQSSYLYGLCSAPPLSSTTTTYTTPSTSSSQFSSSRFISVSRSVTPARGDITLTWLRRQALGTRILQRTTNLLEGTKDVHMSKEMFIRSILPIGILFSGSLILSNTAYLYLSVAYIQMLKVSPTFISTFANC